MQVHIVNALAQAQRQHICQCRRAAWCISTSPTATQSGRDARKRPREHSLVRTQRLNQTHHTATGLPQEKRIWDSRRAKLLEWGQAWLRSSGAGDQDQFPDIPAADLPEVKVTLCLPDASFAPMSQPRKRWLLAVMGRASQSPTGQSRSTRSVPTISLGRRGRRISRMPQGGLSRSGRLQREELSNLPCSTWIRSVSAGQYGLQCF